ncbi:helix-turn-helix domain-containing protein [Hymenobacter jeollabukensis]|uniref:Helix-turn-helix domain-containing protein n=1 Tax=Hymenobacter jeollabukensis TaxID=2025313 RepID=A0A5R8WUV0_9BACT|nr:helix-turn-helix transcriptional regulator [Hymenobacter jeollabukensis]TLM95551.1 helix-turn-helix domain-containing protein [Hymenobacter jeollabukensis]
MKHFTSIGEFHRISGYEPAEHPLLSLLTCQELTHCSFGSSPITTDFYMISLKKIKAGNFLYGKTTYDHDAGSLSFVKPRQVMAINDIELTEKAFVLFMHEDYLLGHPLHAEIKKYGFFDYEANEALHLSPREEQIMWGLYYQMDFEYRNNPDEYSRDIILTHLASLLKYSQRFYKRQFLNRSPLSGTTASRFTDLLTAYFEDGLLQTKGLPTVKYLAEKLHTSPRYLTDLLRQETGKTALDHIHLFLLGEAKNLLISTDNTIAQTAYQLGFENPPYFSRLFKKEVGLTPHEYRAQFLN